MVIRIFYAIAREDRQADYEQLLNVDTIDFMNGQPGLLAYYLGQAPGRDRKYVLVSIWQNLDAVMAFAGENWQEPVALPGEADMVEKTWVEHFEATGNP